VRDEGTKFWLRIMHELRNRGVNDILIALVDGLKGFPEAINAAFPQTQVQTCIPGPSPGDASDAHFPVLRLLG